MNKAIDFYKYIKKNSIEWHWFDNNGVQDVIILPYTFQLEDFMELLLKL